MTFEPLTLVVIAANVLGAAMALPQAFKLLRHRSLEGVSITWAAISVVLNGWWGVYAIGVGDMSIVPVSVVSVLAYLTIGVAITRYTTAPGRLAPATAATLAVATAPVGAFALGGWATVGIVLGALYGIQLSPAVVAVYRSIDVSGVSLATWVIALTEALLWGAYGLADVDVGLIALAVTGVLMSTLVLGRLFVRRPRSAHRDADVPAFATV